jgi:hypothetical protein
VAWVDARSEPRFNNIQRVHEEEVGIVSEPDRECRACQVAGTASTKQIDWELRHDFLSFQQLIVTDDFGRASEAARGTKKSLD